MPARSHTGFTGRNCESALERCNDSLCAHQGICWLESGRPVCYCVPDYHGAACDLRYNECLLPGTKCLNGGRCVDQVDGYSCSCPPDWYAPLCPSLGRSISSLATQDWTEMPTPQSLPSRHHDREASACRDDGAHDDATPHDNGDHPGIRLPAPQNGSTERLDDN